MHDVDFEQYPEEHCKKAVELLQQENVEPEVIHAVCSHGFGHCSDVEPEHEMEKVLFACDELTGLIWAAAKMRPSGSVSDRELKSLKKKFRISVLRRAVPEKLLQKAREKLGWPLEDLMERTILAMRSCETEVNEGNAGSGTRVRIICVTVQLLLICIKNKLLTGIKDAARLSGKDSLAASSFFITFRTENPAELSQQAFPLDPTGKDASAPAQLLSAVLPTGIFC